MRGLRTELLPHLGQLGQVDGVARKVDGVGLAGGGAEGGGRDDEAYDFAAREVLAGRAGEGEAGVADLERKGFPKKQTNRRTPGQPLSIWGGKLPVDKKTGTPKPMFGWSGPPCVILVYLFF